MFSGDPSRERRRVNLAGRNSERKDRRKLLQDARALRASRLKSKTQEDAARKITAFIRGRTLNRKRLAASRTQWDKDLEAKSLPTARMVRVIRSFLDFFDWQSEADHARLHLLVRKLMASVQSKASATNYCSLLMVDKDADSDSDEDDDEVEARRKRMQAWRPDARVWTSQVIALSAILCQHVGTTGTGAGAQSGNGNAVATSVLLLWFFTHATKWPLQALMAGLSKAEASEASTRVKSAQAQLLSSLVSLPRWSLHEALRSRFVFLVPLPAQGDKEVKWGKQDTVSSALIFALAVRPMVAPSMSASARLPAASSFVRHFLSVPLLRRRLQCVGLGSKVAALTAAAVWTQCTDTFSPGRAGDVTPWSSAVSPSYSWWDQPSPPASSSSSSSSSSAAAAAAAMQDDAPARSVFPVRRRAAAYPRDGWLLGNLVELGAKAATADEVGFASYAHALRVLVQRLPPRAFPGEGAGLHPELCAQLNTLQHRTFLDRLLTRGLMEVGQEGEDGQGLADKPKAAAQKRMSVEDQGVREEMESAACLLIDSLLHKWASARGSLLNTLVFSTPLLPKLWGYLRRSRALERLADQRAGDLQPALCSLVSLFCSLYSHLLVILDDDAFLTKPFTKEDVVAMVTLMKKLLYRLYWSDVGSLHDSRDKAPFNPASAAAAEEEDDMMSPLFAFAAAENARDFGGEGAKEDEDDEELDLEQQGVGWAASSIGGGLASRLRATVTSTFKALRDRHSRRAFCDPSLWLMSEISTPVFEEEIRQLHSPLEEQLAPAQQPDAVGAGPGAGAAAVAAAAAAAAAKKRPRPDQQRAGALIRNIPFVIPFDARVRMLYEAIEQDKQIMFQQGVRFDHGLGHRVNIRRQHVLVDGYQALNGLGRSLKGRVQVTFVDEHGMQEAGVDGGGLFKEFLTTLSKVAFNPEYGLFAETPEDRRVYPNPASSAIPNFDNHLDFFAFIGRIIGKALYDGVLLEPQFADFFLNTCLGRYNYVDDLRSLDRDLHRNLLFLKKYDGDFADLALTFSTERESFGATEIVDLIPNGRHVPVTKANRMRFIYLMADFKLNKQMRAQALAFVRGMQDLVDASWLRLFAAEELRLLISGTERAFATADLRAQTNYANGYADQHELIRWFWEVVDGFDDNQKSLFLRFATSCSRAPLLGFSTLDPKFCIQHMGNNQDSLPTSSTCMNLLRVPRYRSKARLKAKLLYAISAGAGFGLS